MLWNLLVVQGGEHWNSSLAETSLLCLGRKGSSSRGGAEALRSPGLPLPPGLAGDFGAQLAGRAGCRLG